jgi:hypothetical protein
MKYWDETPIDAVFNMKVYRRRGILGYGELSRSHYDSLDKRDSDVMVILLRNGGIRVANRIYIKPFIRDERESLFKALRECVSNGTDANETV